MPKDPSEQNNTLAGAGGGNFLVVSRGMFGTYAREGSGRIDAVQSPKLVDWDLTKDSRHFSSSQMTHVLNNVANPWQILLRFSSFAMSIWRLVLG